MQFKVEEKYKNSSGIYSIINNITGKYYIGSAIDFYDRFMFHKWQLKNNRHDNSHLQKSYNKYGNCEFSFNLLELLSPKDDLIEREQFYIDLLEAADLELGYNLSPTAGSNFGTKRTQASKDKVSATNGRKVYKLDKITGELLDVYDSVSIAARENNCNVGVVKSCCLGEKKTYKGYVWQYDKNEKPKIRFHGEPITEEIILKRLKSFNPKKIFHVSPDGFVVREYNSRYEAVKATGINSSSINGVLCGHRKSVFSQVFFYE
jgi:group I intron endonuclease